MKTYESILSKIIGLMFSRRIDDYGLFFPFEKEQVISLHMFFVFYPIDVIFLNKNRKVVEIKRSFRPFQIYTSKRKAKFIIELPVNSTKKTEIGDKIEFTL